MLAMTVTSAQLDSYSLNALCFNEISYFLSVECAVTALLASPEYDGHMLLALELFFIGLLGLASLAIAWISGIVVYKLFKGQR
jgi:hypothetical protein